MKEEQATKIIKIRDWILVHQDGTPVQKGEVVKSFRGEKAKVKDGLPPKHFGSEGHVEVIWLSNKVNFCYYVSVFNLKWKREDE